MGKENSYVLFTDYIQGIPLLQIGRLKENRWELTVDAVLTSDKMYFKTKSIVMVRESYYLVIKQQFARKKYINPGPILLSRIISKIYTK